MAIVASPLIGNLAARVYEQAVTDKTTFGTADAVTVFAIWIDPGSAAAKNYLNVYDAADPTVGTTDCEMRLPVPTGSPILYFFGATGFAFGTQMVMALVGDKGDTVTDEPDTGATIRWWTNAP